IGSLFRFVVGVFSNTSRLTTARTQVVQFRTTNFTATNNVDRVDVGRVQREHTFHTFAERDFTNGERRSQSRAATTADDNAFVVLDTRAGALGHFEANANGVASFEIRNGLAESCDLLGFDLGDQVHTWSFPNCLRYCRRGGAARELSV